MFRPGINGRFLAFFFLFPLILQTSCGDAQVLGIPIQEAAELLRNSDTAFIRQAELFPAFNLSNFSSADFFRAVFRLKQLSLIHPAASFYAGLLFEEDFQGETKNSPSSREIKIFLFCASLESPSLPARREAALKLIPLILETKEEREARYLLDMLGSGSLKTKTDYFTALRAACLYRLGRHEEIVKILAANFAVAGTITGGSAEEWKKALTFFAAWQLHPTGNTESYRQEFLAFLFGNLTAGVRQWAYEEALSLEGLLNQEEQKILQDMVSPAGYGTTLNSLRPALSDGGILFMRYPDLIAVLGRAYQYTSAMREEGAELFQSWDKLLEENGIFALPPSLAGREEKGEFKELLSYIYSLDSKALGSRKYFVRFYAGRIERARGNYAGSSEFFSRALEYAPDAMQSDACIWYMLMNALDNNPSGAVSVVLNTLPRWNDVSYFSDALDRLASYLTRRRQWASLLEIYLCLEGRGASVSLAQYAWILGRASQEGHVKTDRGAESFFLAAFEGGNASFYYRAMAASKLGLSFAPEGDSPKTEKAIQTKTRDDGRRKTEAGLILGFFEYCMDAFALPYLEALESRLSIPELREIAGALAASGRWKESLDLVSRYTRLENYQINSQDLRLFYPLPYRELIENYSREAELGPEILYGLIRTESYFMPEVVSRSGAVGLTQLMPATAVDMAGRIARQGGPDYRGSSGINLKDPEVNIHIGSYYLRYLIEQTGSPMPALLAYNGGIGRLRRWLAADMRLGGFPYDLFLETIEYNETREYGRKVLAAAAVYGYLYYGMSMEEVATDIYPPDMRR